MSLKLLYFLACTSRQIGSALASLFEQGGFSEGYRVRTTPHVIGRLYM